MFVDTGLLHSGADDSHRAGGHAGDGANHLARTSPAAEMFGDFAAAHEFHQAVSQTRTHHTKQLRGHQQTLSDVGDKARTVATAFTNMEERNTVKLDAVRCNSNT
jgi:exonuclease V gamma subunit